MRKAWVNVGEVEHTSERVWKSVERGVGAEGLRNGVGMRTGRGGVQNWVSPNNSLMHTFQRDLT